MAIATIDTPDKDQTAMRDRVVETARQASHLAP